MIAATEQNEADVQQQSPVLRFVAQVFSYTFHPLFIPLYISAFLLFVHPSYFAGLSVTEKKMRLISIAITAIFFPAFTVFLLKQLKFIDSIFLRTQRDRIIPYIASGTFYFWMFWVTKNVLYPSIVVSFMLGICISAFAALMVNIRSKISMHAIGMGGTIGLFILIMNSNTMLMTWPLALAILIAGLVCSSRLIVSDHSPKDIYLGLLLGAGAQFAAALFV